MGKFALLSYLLILINPLSANETTDRVRFETTKGDIEIALFDNEAPVSVDNFKAYIRSNFYDGTIFHRVIPGFMVQGGGFESDLTFKKTEQPIINEADNGLSNLRGTLAMARTSVPHSATGQFFINHKDNSFLNHTGKNSRGWGYAVFGRVTKGMEVVDEIAAVATTTKNRMENVPVENVSIIKAYLLYD
jgi:peptidyl-prolyl cis-trans isomerase B (cyclophilin B)